jgi:hypothetical protein
MEGVNGRHAFAKTNPISRGAVGRQLHDHRSDNAEIGALRRRESRISCHFRNI